MSETLQTKTFGGGVTHRIVLDPDTAHNYRGAQKSNSELMYSRSQGKSS